MTNTVAYAQACESALGFAPDRHLRRARTLLLELERLYNHLNDISAICAGVGFAPGAMAFAAFKERAQRLNQRLAGHRFLFDTVALAIEHAAYRAGRRARGPRGADGRWTRSSGRMWRELQFAASLQDRLGEVGTLTKQDAIRLGRGRPVRSRRRRASGHAQRKPATRLRRVHARRPQNAPSGDVAARLDMRKVELEQTFAILDELLTGRSAPGGVKDLSIAASDIGVARVESPRGETVCAVQTDGHTVGRLHLRTGSYANWPVARARLPAKTCCQTFP